MRSEEREVKRFTIRDMAMTAVFTAVLCAVAPFSLFIGPIPLSFATFIIYLAAGTLDFRSGVVSVALYVALGAVGLPVFTGFEGGFQKIAGVTGGFIIGYIVCAAAIGSVMLLPGKKRFTYIFGMVIGTLLLYTCGTAWFMLQTGSSLRASLMLCAVPFFPGDAAKIAAASIIAPQLRRAIR